MDDKNDSAAIWCALMDVSYITSQEHPTINGIKSLLTMAKPTNTPCPSNCSVTSWGLQDHGGSQAWIDLNSCTSALSLMLSLPPTTPLAPTRKEILSSSTEIWQTPANLGMMVPAAMLDQCILPKDHI